MRYSVALLIPAKIGSAGVPPKLDVAGSIPVARSNARPRGSQ
jgi:hypothetical protein